MKVFCQLTATGFLFQFDDDAGEKAKEAYATFCNRQKFALENVKVICH